MSHVITIKNGDAEGDVYLMEEQQSSFHNGDTVKYSTDTRIDLGQGRLRHDGNNACVRRTHTIHREIS